MNQIQRRIMIVVVAGSVILLTGCPPPTPSGPDTSPPGFVQVLVQLEAPTGPNPRGEFEITSSDVTKNKLASDLKIRVIATAGDPESGITGITLATRPDPSTGSPQNLTFRCSSGGPPGGLTPIIRRTLLPFTFGTPPSPPPSVWQINAVADPIATTGCTINTTGAGPIDIEGFIRVMATNGAGLTTQSGTFLFDYADVGTQQ